MAVDLKAIEQKIEKGEALTAEETREVMSMPNEGSPGATLGSEKKEEKQEEKKEPEKKEEAKAEPEKKKEIEE